MSDLEMIHVNYAITDKTGGYTKIAGTSICSLLENTSSPVTIHVTHDDALSEENKCKLRQLVDIYHQRIIFYNVNRYEQMWKEIKAKIPALENSRLSIATFFRLIMGELLPIKRIIYLDADTIVNLDIMELWKEKIPDSGIAAAPDAVLQKNVHNLTQSGVIKQEEYFNAGVLLINLDSYRNIGDLKDKSINFIEQYNPDYLDQDILNYYFPHSCVLPDKYNLLVVEAKEQRQPVGNCIYHYANNILGLHMSDEFNSLFFKYFTKTPWFDKSFLGKMIEEFDTVKFEMIKIANTCAGRRRIVIGREAARDSASSLLELKENELYIPFERIEEYQLDFKKNKDVFLVIMNEGEYGQLKDKFLSLGLLEGRHFIDMYAKLGFLKSRLSEYGMFLAC